MAAVAAFVALALALAVQWHDRSEPAAAEPRSTTLGRAEETRASAGITSDATPSPPPVAAPQDVAATPSESTAPTQDFATVLARIDPSLIGQNVIQRAADPASDGAKFGELDALFAAESVDPSWSDGMEARILAQVAQVPNLGLASIETECRQTICRVKLFYPPGANALSSLEKLRPIAKQIGFAHVAEVATLGEQGVPISLLYFERDGA